MKLFQTEYSQEDGWGEALPDWDSEQTLVLVFASPEFQESHSFWQDLKNTYPNAIMMGCSTAGEIIGDLVNDETAVVQVTQFESSHLAQGVQAVGDQSPFAVGVALGQQFSLERNGQPLAGVFVLSEGLNMNGSDLAKGLNESLPNIAITGGLAGDTTNFAATWVYDGKIAASNQVVAVGFYGDKLRFSHGSKGGWDIFGPERLVTKATGSELFTLDGRPALELYKEYLGELAKDLPASGLLFPLAMNGISEEPIVRTVLAVNEATQSMTFAGDVPEGTNVQLMRANFDRLIMGAEQAAEDACKTQQDQPVLAIAVSCIGRKLILKGRVDEEVE